MALAAGAAGVGVGAAVNKLNVQIAMIAVVREIATAMKLEAREQKQHAAVVEAVTANAL